MWLAAERRSLRVRLLAIAALAVNLPPTKVSLQCKAAVPVTCERCDHVFRSKRKAERNSMKRMRAVESDTVKPPNKGHFGDRPVVPCREVVLFSEVLF